MEKMTYENARMYLDETGKYGSVPGLDSIRELLDRLGNPQDDLKFIHIAGTNGKGSTLAFVSAILKEANLITGSYSSPSVFSYREKIRINDEYISKEAVAEIITKIKNVCDTMVKDNLPHPTSFEVETAMAFLYFKMKKCDIVVLETGMGGKLDATNIIRNTLICAIASISMDHMGFLGNSLQEIAMQKAGIIKQNVSVVTTLQKKEVMEVIKGVSMQNNADLRIADYKEAYDIKFESSFTCFSYKTFKDIKIKLLGTYQLQNAVLALETIYALNEFSDFHITDEAIYNGMKNAIWNGRFYKISDNPLFFIDGAHNENAVIRLMETLDTYYPDKRIIYIMAVFADKEYKKICKTACKRASHIIVTETPDNDRALSSDILMKEALKYNDNVFKEKIISDAVSKARELAIKENAIIIAFGSLSFLKEIK